MNKHKILLIVLIVINLFSIWRFESRTKEVEAELKRINQNISLINNKINENQENVILALRHEIVKGVQLIQQEDFFKR